MPQTDDPAALATAERDVRRQFREDLRAIGAGDAAGNDLAGDPTTTAGQRPGAAVDYSTLSPLQQIAVGLRDAKPTGAGRRGATMEPQNPTGNGGTDRDHGHGSPAGTIVAGSD